jgi:cytochrome c oxidase assembly factor CtaG
VTPLTAATLASWSFPLLPIAALAATAAVYVRGWRDLRRQMPERFSGWRLAAFLGSLAALLIAVASPLDALASWLLSAHMVQHLLLTMVAPPLFWLGAPQIPLLRGLPIALAKDGLGPFLAWPALRRALERLSHPVVALVVFVAVTWIWHVPALYELALRSRAWHEVEHVSFFAAALLFWWPVVQPWPSRARWPRWAMLPYLALADLQNTALSALFAFSERVIYPTYAAAPRLGQASALDDQALAGALMWVPGQMAFLLPVGLILAGLLGPARAAPAPAGRQSFDAPHRRRARADLLAVPALGRLLARSTTRRIAQLVVLLLAIGVVADGLTGPSMAPMNLAGVLPWTHFRGFAVVALLVAGNAFCFACPFMLPREAAKRLLPARWRWPQRLRSKWLAVGLLVAWFTAYEALDPWSSPASTAWIVVGYFAGAFVVDGLFRGASFCKYVCPIGQFHFVTSTVSPLEVRVRDVDACVRCSTHDCIRGRGALRGCETDLFLPRKVGNLDCTFCLDCVRACPHDNIGLLAVVPGADLARDVRRSSLGRLSRRSDVAALVLVLVFAAFANAAGMIGPAAAAEAELARGIGLDSPRAATVLVLLVALVAAPLLACLLCAAIGRRLAGLRTPLREVICSFAFALVPLGVGMWAAHLLFHLATGTGAVIPVAQRIAIDLGAPIFGLPDWSSGGSAATSWLLPAKLLLLDAGLCLTIIVGWHVARHLVPRGRAVLGLLGPWAGLATALWIAGVWILLQPMEMRGAMIH